jgi:hypothetical protein
MLKHLLITNGWSYRKKKSVVTGTLISSGKKSEIFAKRKKKALHQIIN